VLKQLKTCTPHISSYSSFYIIWFLWLGSLRYNKIMILFLIYFLSEVYNWNTTMNHMYLGSFISIHLILQYKLRVLKFKSFNYSQNLQIFFLVWGFKVIHKLNNLDIILEHTTFLIRCRTFEIVHFFQTLTCTFHEFYNFDPLLYNKVKVQGWFKVNKVEQTFQHYHGFIIFVLLKTCCLIYFLHACVKKLWLSSFWFLKYSAFIITFKIPKTIMNLLIQILME